MRRECLPDSLENEGSISASASGFRGGIVDNNSNFPAAYPDFRSTDSNRGANKGESVAGFTTDYVNGGFCRGAPANGVYQEGKGLSVSLT